MMVPIGIDDFHVGTPNCDCYHSRPQCLRVWEFARRRSLGGDCHCYIMRMRRIMLPEGVRNWENLRICPFCHLNEIEKESHFLFNCNIYDSLQSNFYKNISNRQPLSNNFDNNAKTCSYLTMSILISTDLQLLTYIYVWNIDKNLFFNYSLFSLLRFITNNVGNTIYSRNHLHNSSKDTQPHSLIVKYC